MTLPITLTPKVKTPGADVAALGDITVLAAAYETGTPITLTGKHEGEIVYLGHTRQTYDDGAGVETIGLDRVWGESPKFPGHTIAAYLIDMTRLEGAPKLAALARKVNADRLADAVAVSARVEAEDDRLENLAEDGS